MEKFTNLSLEKDLISKISLYWILNSINRRITASICLTLFKLKKSKPILTISLLLKVFVLFATETPQLEKSNNNFYVQAEIGYTTHNFFEYDNFSYRNNFRKQEVKKVTEDFKGLNGGIALGYDGLNGIRGDLRLAKSKLFLEENGDKLNLSLLIIMLNLYIDFWTLESTDFSLYGIIGVGYQRSKLEIDYKNKIMSNPNNSFIGSLGLGVAYKINKNFTADISARYSVSSGKYVFDNSVGKMKIGLDRASNFMYSFGLRYYL